MQFPKCINIFRERAKLYFGRNSESWACWISSAVFPVCRSRSCNQGAFSSTVVQMFNRLPTYSKSNRLVLQKNISWDSAIRNENIRFFFTCITCTVFMWNVLTWKLVVLAFASKIVLSNITGCDGCGPQHCSWGTADQRCFKFLIT